MRNATGVLGLGRVNRGVADRRIGRRREAAHGRRGGVGRGLLEAGARYLVLHSHHLGAVAGGRVVAAGHQ